MNYNLDIQKVLLNAQKSNATEDKIILTKQAIHIADANNDIDWGFDLRSDLIHLEGYTARSHESISAFAWMLHTCDTNPDLFDEAELLRTYSWLIHKVFDHVNISRTEIENIIEDYAVRLQRNGFGKREYYDIRVGWELFNGDEKSARKYLEMRNKEPFDSMSSNGELMSDICVELLEGNIEKGILLVNEFIAKNPDSEISAYCILVYYLNKYRDKRTAYYFEKADKLFSEAKKYPYMLFEAIQLMYYLSRNDHEKGWHYFEQYAEWEIEANEYFRFDFATSVLPLFVGEGKRTLELSSKLPYYNAENVYEPKNLFEYYHAQATEMAALFDARNGNSYFTKQLDHVLKD